jgi:hypothetical protein
MRGDLLALALLVPASPLAGSEVTVRVVEGRVDLSATAAPIADVLDRLSKQTGMKVVYEGAPPRQLVTVSFQGRTPADAILGLLEGQGLNYILMGDATGTRVQTLMMAGAAPVASSRPASASAVSRVPNPPPASGPDAEEPVAEPAEEDEPEPTPAAPPNPAIPGGAPLVPGLVPGGMPNPVPTAPNSSPAYTIPTFPAGVPPGLTTSPFNPTPFGPQPTSPQVTTPPQAGATGTPAGQEPTPP